MNDLNIGTVSVLCCAHCPDSSYVNLLQQALFSVVNQTRQPEEIVVVLDECVPEASTMVKEMARNTWPQFKIVSRPKKEGLAFAKNEGLKHCEGEWIGFVDCDDSWMQCKLEIQKSFLGWNNFNVYQMPVDFCFTEAWDSYDGLWRPNCFEVGQYKTDLQIREALQRENVLCHGSALIRKDALIKLGGYRHVKGMEDWDLWKRAVAAGYRFHKIPERLYIMVWV